MKKCKSCGKTEWGYASLLNEEGFCWKCANKHLKKRINELEKIVKNQPLIKKYQKTLDIFLKNT